MHSSRILEGLAHACVPSVLDDPAEGFEDPHGRVPRTVPAVRNHSIFQDHLQQSVDSSIDESIQITSSCYQHGEVFWEWKGVKST